MKSERRWRKGRKKETNVAENDDVMFALGDDRDKRR